MTVTASRSSNATSRDSIGPVLRIGDLPGALTHIDSDNEWLEYARYRIKEAFALEPNWDLEGAEEVKVDTLETAEWLAETLSEQGINRPFIVPAQEGGIVFEWIDSSIELSIAVVGRKATGHIYYVGTRQEVEGPIGDITSDLTSALDAFTA